MHTESVDACRLRSRALAASALVPGSMTSELIEITEARRLVIEHCAPLGAEEVSLDHALGRILADDIVSTEAVPAFDNSAMDGFAVRALDTTGAGEDPIMLAVVDESRAGSPARRALGVGEAIAISTGAALPEGADAVVPVEETSESNGSISIGAQATPGNHVRAAGEDMRPGRRVLERGTELAPPELGILAALGRPQVMCTRRPKVAIVTTGDELVEPSEPLRQGAVRNANAYTLSALGARAGADVVAVETAPDDPLEVRRRIEAALDFDLALICGGVSVGRHDHVRPALGVKQLFWGLALRPGKPTWFGVLDRERRTLVFALPGNPVSAIVTFTLLAQYAIRALLGQRSEVKSTTAILDEAYAKRPGRAHAIRCRLELQDDGWHVSPTGEQGSHVLTSMVGARALAIIPTATASVSAGERVEIELLG